MKTTLTLACCALLASTALTATSDAQAREKRKIQKVPSWYLSLSGSTSFVSDADLSENSSGVISNAEMSFKDGYGIAGAIGYHPRYTGTFWDNTRFEVELGMIDNDIDNISVTGVGTSLVNGDIQAQRLMANMYLEYNTPAPMRPYIGGGIGYATLHTQSGEDDSVFAYQGMVGVAYTPSSFPVLEFMGGYRYFAADEAEFFTSTGDRVTLDYDAHLLEVGMRAYF